jgi:NUMOD3 motif/NUMOD1 domain
LKRGESIIYRALLKYGYLSFEFILLESKEILDNDLDAGEIKKLEQYYIDNLKPDYNILALAGSNRGHKMSFKTRAKMSLAKKGQVSHRKGSKHSTDSKLLMKINSGRKKRVFVYTMENIFIKTYDSITECSKELKISPLVIRGLPIKLCKTNMSLAIKILKTHSIISLAVDLQSFSALVNLLLIILS